MTIRNTSMGMTDIMDKKFIAKFKRREKKKTPKMKVSGRGVRELQRIIIKKARA